MIHYNYGKTTETRCHKIFLGVGDKTTIGPQIFGTVITTLRFETLKIVFKSMWRPTCTVAYGLPTPAQEDISDMDVAGTLSRETRTLPSPDKHAHTQRRNHYPTLII